MGLDIGCLHVLCRNVIHAQVTENIQIKVGDHGMQMDSSNAGILKV